jgi:hypothetical protein
MLRRFIIDTFLTNGDIFLYVFVATTNHFSIERSTEAGFTHLAANATDCGIFLADFGLY